MTSQKGNYTLVLVPPASMSEQLTGFSSDLAAVNESVVVLGDQALPHITVVQWQDAELADLQEQLRMVLGRTLGEVVLAGFSVVPGPDGDSWLEVPVLGASWLRDLQEAALAATTGNGQIANGVGDQYRPHVTVGLTFGSTVTLPSLSAGLLRQRSKEWTMALGVSGPNYTVPSLLPFEGDGS